MAFHFLSKTPPSQLWLRHWFSKANNSLACIWDQLDGCVSWDEWEVWAGTWEVGSGRMGPAHEARQPHKILLPVTTDVPLALTLQVQQVQHPIASLTEPNVIAVPQFDCSPPVWVLLCTESCPVPAVCQRKLHCPRCTDPHSIPNATCHYFWEIQGTNFSTFILPLTSLLLSDLLLRFQKNIDFYFIGKQQNWNKWLLAEHILCFTENLSAWCPWNAQCD